MLILITLTSLCITLTSLYLVLIRIIIVPVTTLSLFRYEQVPGRAVVHLGRRRHGADDIEGGRRLNLIMWNYSPDYQNSAEYRRRAALYAREAGPPDPICVSLTHDRDVQLHPTPELAVQRHLASAWCPPPAAEYPGFWGVPGRYGAGQPARRNLPTED